MPQDATCPKCTHAFPVTEARHAFTVICPKCETAMTAEFKKPAAPPDAGQPPYELLVKPGALNDVAAAPPTPKKQIVYDDEKMRGGGSAMVVLLSGGLGLLFVLGGLTLTGWYLFTQIDMEDTTVSRPNTNPNTNRPSGNTPNTTPGWPNNTPRPNIPGNNGGNQGPPPWPGFPNTPVEKKEFDLRPVRGTLTPITPPNDLDEGLPKKFPLGNAKVDTVAVGGGGRYIIIHSEDGQIQLFDANAADMVKDVAMPETGRVLMTAGANTLAVLLPGFSSKTIRVYSLPDLKKQNEFTLPMNFGPKSITMGASTNGPLLAVDFTGEVALMDISSGKPIDGASGKIGMPYDHVRAPHDGKMFVAGNNYRFDEKFSIVTESGRKWQVKPTEIASVYPSADGERLYGKNQIITTNGNMVAGKPRAVQNAWYVPAITPTGEYFVRVNEMRTTTPPLKIGVSISIHKGRDVDDPVIPALEMLPEADRLVNTHFVSVEALDRHVFLIPEAKLLVLLNHERNRLVVRKLAF
jgi:hypothetical protein